jgi:hypothetical protein
MKSARKNEDVLKAVSGIKTYLRAFIGLMPLFTSHRIESGYFPSRKLA